jgi:hypothetical protein
VGVTPVLQFGLYASARVLAQPGRLAAGETADKAVCATPPSRHPRFE